MQDPADTSLQAVIPGDHHRDVRCGDGSESAGRLRGPIRYESSDERKMIGEDTQWPDMLCTLKPVCPHEVMLDTGSTK